MREFKKVNKTFIKSNNSTTKIYNRYLYCLIPFVLFIMIYNLIWGSRLIVINLLRNIVISLVVSLLFSYIIKKIRKENNFKNALFKDNILSISIILGLFSLNSSVIVVVIASLVSMIIRYMFKNNTLSSSLYGILILLIFAYYNKVDNPLYNLSNLGYIDSYDNVVKSYGSILSYSLGFKYYLSPVLSIIAFIYLFTKKSIKYNLVVSYIFTFSIIMLIFGFLNNMNIWYLFFQICTGDILFLTVFCLVDYPSSPITSEGQIIYGIVLGVITSILRFIIPSLSVVVTLIFGTFLFTKLIDKISVKLKYNKKFYYMVLGGSLMFGIITIICLNILI